MAEREAEVKTFVIQYICDTCNTGVMKPQELMLTVHPPLYCHKCDNCEATKNFDEKYPRVVYRYI
jgi:hypothetical protein